MVASFSLTMGRLHDPLVRFCFCRTSPGTPTLAPAGGAVQGGAAQTGPQQPGHHRILELAPAPPPEQHFPDLPKPWNGSTRRGWACLVTVDNGISARPALEQAQALGVEMIVTDHHAAMI